ncbi:MAG: DNA topology modulation protein [Oscillospiraceae bacterium]
MKIAIIGYSGSGKSTMAKTLSEYYSCPLLYLDTIQFKENWKERDKDEAKAMVRDFMKNDSWVIDGNYTDFYQKERLLEANQIIFLNFPTILCLYQALKRYKKYKNQTRESAAQGCFEKMDFEFIWWILFGGRKKKHKENYKNIVKTYKAKTVVLKNRKQANDFLMSYDKT